MIRIQRGTHEAQQPLITCDSYGIWYGIYKTEPGYEPTTILFYYGRLDHDGYWNS